MSGFLRVFYQGVDLAPRSQTRASRRAAILAPRDKTTGYAAAVALSVSFFFWFPVSRVSFAEREREKRPAEKKRLNIFHRISRDTFFFFSIFDFSFCLFVPPARVCQQHTPHARAHT
nr:hypothetical protein [Pandoravirus belohorizontensis]